MLSNEDVNREEGFLQYGFLISCMILSKKINIFNLFLQIKYKLLVCTITTKLNCQSK